MDFGGRERSGKDRQPAPHAFRLGAESRPRERVHFQEIVIMKKLLMTVALAALAVSAVVGCKAEVAPDGSVTSNVVSPR